MSGSELGGTLEGPQSHHSTLPVLHALGFPCTEGAAPLCPYGAVRAHSDAQRSSLGSPADGEWGSEGRWGALQLGWLLEGLCSAPQSCEMRSALGSMVSACSRAACCSLPRAH